MNPLNTLAACAGSWRGTSTLQDPHASVADESPSTAAVTSLSDGSVRLDYTWSYRGEPQQGSILFDLHGGSESLTARWTDTWHTGNQPMACSGPSSGGTTLSVRGTYAARPGLGLADRRYAKRREAAGGHAQRLAPGAGGDKEELAVKAVYTRA